MAGIADLLIKGTMDAGQNAGNDLKTGAALAESIQNIQSQRAALEQKKAEHSLQKYSKVTDMIKIAHESKDPAIANSLWKYAIPNAVRALGAEDAFTEEFLETAAKSPETREKVLGYQSEIQDLIANKGMTAQKAVEQVVATISDPLARAALDTDRIIKAQETAAAEKASTERTKMQAEATLGKQMQAQDAAPLVDEAKKVRADFLKFTQTGKANAEANLKKLRDSVAYFKEQSEKPGGGSTGGFTTAAASRVGLLGLKDPKLKVAVDNARAGIKLKETLDSQFALKEAEQQYSMRGPDVDLPASENYQRALDQLNEAEAAYKNKMNLFKQRGLQVEDAESKDSDVVELGGRKLSKKALREKAKDPAWLKRAADKEGKSIEEYKKLIGM